METPTDLQQHRDLSVKGRTQEELVKRILKLRWMGMEIEAEHIIEVELEKREADVVTLSAGPFDTD